MPQPIEIEILNGLIFDAEFAKLALPHFEDEYFSDDGTRTVLNLARDYICKYGSQPTLDALAIDLQSVKELTQDQFEGAKGIIEDLKPSETDYKWLVDKAEGFCQDRALYLGIMQAIHIVDGKETKHGISKGAIPDLLQKALAVNFDRSIGHDYFSQADARFAFYHNDEEHIPFDLEMLNRITKGGLYRKTLNVLTGAPGMGKTLVMCHIAAAYVSAGLKVLYITMEMSEERIAQRIDANLLDVSLNEIENISKADFDAKVSRIRARTTGDIVIKEFPTGSGNVNHFRHLLSELNQKKRFTPDAIFVDYMNICSSARYRNGDGVNSYSVVKSIAEELRGMAVEFNVPVVTATQFNREGAGSSDPEMTNTSDSFGTPMTADLQLAIYSTPDLDEQGKLVIKQLKNRYNDKTEYKKFLLRVDKSKMRLMDDDVLDSYSTSLTEKEKKNVDEMITARKPTHDEKAFDGFDFGEEQ